MKKQIFVLISLFAIAPTYSIASEKLPNCAELSDQFCENLWSPEHKGNLEENGYALYFGDSSKSELSILDVKYYESFIAAVKSFPSDLRKNLTTTIRKLENLLNNQKPGNSWIWEFNEVTGHINIILRKTSDERVYINHPELLDIKWEDYTLMDRMPLRQSQYDLKNQVMDLQFKNDPNWKRIERIFFEVQKDLLEFISQEFPVEVRPYAYNKVASIKLSLPYEDPRTLNTSAGCASTTINAYYHSTFNTFTVCVGWFTAMQDDAANYLTIAHEIAHSIDPNNYNLDFFQKTEIGQLFNKFYRAKGPIESCEEWEKDRNTMLADAEFIEGVSPYDRLTSCLRPRDDLYPFDEHPVKTAADRRTKIEMGDSADYNFFTYLAQPTIQKYGKTRANEFYMRPDRLNAWYNTDLNLSESATLIGLPEAELFTQILSCTSHENNPLQGFTEALKEFYSIKEVYINRLFAFCGRECSILEADNLALDSSELFADWVAHKLFYKRVLREPTLEAKRSFVARSESSSCTRPGPLKDAPHFTKAEKGYSLEPHPDDRVRRLNVFQPEIVELIQCQASDELPTGEQDCDF